MEEVEMVSSIPEGPPLHYCIYYYDDDSSVWKVKFDYTSDDAYTITYWYYYMPAAINSTNGIGPIANMGFDTLLLWCATMLAREKHDPEGHALAMQNYTYELKQ